MCTTIDGKILTKRWGRVPGPKTSASLFESTADRFGVSAWVVGTTTMKEFAGREQKLPAAPRGFVRGDHIARQRASGYAIGADAKAVLRFQHGESDGDHVVLLLTQRAGNAYLAHLQAAGVSYLFCGERDIDLHVALDKLSRYFGLKKLMLEGGGTFNGAMLHAGLVDEISQVVVPIVDGGRGVSGFFDIPGDPPPKAAATLRVIRRQTLPGGTLWTRYKVLRDPR